MWGVEAPNCDVEENTFCSFDDRVYALRYVFGCRRRFTIIDSFQSDSSLVGGE
jgi:hypothetical protein